MALEFMVSNKGRTVLIHDGYDFWLKRTSQNGKKSWRCTKHQSFMCPATLVTVENQIIKEVADHNHGRNKAKVMAKKAVEKMKEKFAEGTITPEACQAAVNIDLPPSVLMALPQKSSISRTLNRHRQRIRRKDNTQPSLWRIPEKVKLNCKIATVTTKMDANEYRVLAVQSHVVSGYVGNRSATFPLQVLGFEVDVINSTHLSNHTGYGYWKGQILSKTELEEIIDGLKHNGLDNYTHVLSGYVRDAGFLESFGDYIKNLKRTNPSLCFVCSPVMGDNKRMYVPKEMLPIYKDVIVPLADIVTGNQFEFELLSDRTIDNMEDALEAIDAVHDLGPEIAVITSTDFGGDNNLISIASRRRGKKREVLKIEVPRFPASFTGTGDLFAAIFLAWFAKTKDLQATFENVIATMFAVLKRTFQEARRKSGGDNLTIGALELRLIQSKLDIERPACTFTAEHLDT